MTAAGPRVGVLAVQGAFARHVEVMGELGADAVEIRQPRDLDGVDALIMPGGESTTMSMLLERIGLFDPIAEMLDRGVPAFGTCAGMILLSGEVLDGRPDQRCFATMDLSVRRNGYGRQIDSFESDLAVDGLDDDFRAVFIRAPVIERLGGDVDVLASVDDQPVLCRQGAAMVASFHPELSNDMRLHELFLAGM